jgi:hypothetical protein
VTAPLLTPSEAAENLTGHHRGQHRCDDGRWYGPREWQTCPMHVAAGALLDAIDAERRRVHEAAHDADAVRVVAEGMTGLVMAELSADDAHGWQTTARMAIEALAGHLDPDVRALDVECPKCHAGVNEPCDAGLHS